MLLYISSGRVESTMLISELTTSSSPPPPPPPSSLSPSKKKCRNWFYFCFGVEIENLGFLNTDVPFNALSCFPTKILLGLKCVSKGWHQLIFDRSFIQAQLQKQKPIVSGFIFQGKYQWGNEDIETVSYIPAVESEDEAQDPAIYVCNPPNKEWIKFKSPSALDNLTTIGLAFDPTQDPVYSSTKFKLVRVRPLEIETETEERRRRAYIILLKYTHQNLGRGHNQMRFATAITI
nr:hypothetical protein CFP56_37003 [Quercus suber]